MVASSTWNPSDKSTDITLSASNSTATTNGVSGVNEWQAVRSTPTSHTSGKQYFEVDITAADAKYRNIGVANATMPLTDYIGQDANSVAIQAIGGTTVGPGEFFQSATGFAAASNIPTQSYVGVTIGVAIDITNHLIWATKDGTTWNSSGSPGAGTGGASYTAITGALFCAVAASTDGGANTSLVLNTAAPFTFAIPSGFSAWDSGGTCYRSLLGVGCSIGWRASLVWRMARAIESNDTITRRRIILPRWPRR